MKHLFSIKKPFQAVLLSPVSCTDELIPFDLFIFHGKICGAPPTPTLSETQACSQPLVFSRVGPEGGVLSQHCGQITTRSGWVRGTQGDVTSEGFSNSTHWHLKNT